jgi:5-methylcytosine-specific restriction endonuclease McrA
MKNSDVDWSKVENKIESCIIKRKNVTYKYDVLKYKHDKNNKIYFKVVVSLPFSCESSWGVTKYNSWDERVCTVIKSVSDKRFNNIKRRNYKARKIKEFFDNNISREELFHKSLTEKINDTCIGDYVKVYEDEIKKYVNIKLEDYIGEEILDIYKFKKLLLDGKCEYCGVTMEDINDLSEKEEIHTKRARGYSMEIDQKEPNGLYTDDNCVASCYWCNNAKTDEFSVKEFEEIARGINKVWEKRLGKKIDFPTKVYKEA